MSEKELIHACLRGDNQSFRRLYDRYAAKMMTVCLRYARHRLEAEDLLQDGFVKVFNNLEKFQHKGSFEGWIRRIMINTALKNNGRSSFKNERIGLEDYQSGSQDPKVLAKLSEEEILKAIAELPEGYRRVFNMYVIDGLSHKEIGEILNITDSTSRSQLVKARKLLQLKIEALQKVSL